MQISSYNNSYKNVNRQSFKNSPVKALQRTEELGHTIINLVQKNAHPNEMQEVVKGEAPFYLRLLSAPIRKMAPFVEENMTKKREVEDLVNFGNCLKELVCMVVYPLQVMTNPDLPEEKRRFVGLYDFFVTCFSLGGTLLFIWKGKKLTDKLADNLMKKYTAEPNLYPKAKRAVKGGAFVIGIAVQTILFKRILAPAFAPVLAGKARKALEDRDAKKGKEISENTQK